MPEEMNQLQDRAAELSKRASALVERRSAAVGEASRELHLARTAHLRRASIPGSRDNIVYAIGSAAEALQALDLDPIAILGFQAAGALTYRWLVEAAEADPGGTYFDHVRSALRQPQRLRYCLELGAYHRFHWKRAVYQQLVDDWQASPAAQDPDHPWRRRSVTAGQWYLIRLIAECRSAVDPAFVSPSPTTREAAHDWLRAAGGHPLFKHPPTPPLWPGQE